VIWGDRAIAIPDWFPDGKRLLYLSQNPEAGTIIGAVVIRDLATGQEQVLFRAAPGATIDDIALSPDGKQVALTLLEEQTRSSILKLLPVAGGDASELVRAKEPEVIVGDSLSWSIRATSSSKRPVTGQGEAQLLAISPVAEEPHALGLAMVPSAAFLLAERSPPRFCARKAKTR
jgi:hypothetical protein